jgi:hypothetical protein
MLISAKETKVVPRSSGDAPLPYKMLWLAPRPHAPLLGKRSSQCTILCLGRVRMTRGFPLAKNLFVAYSRRIKLDEKRFRKIFHLGIRRIGLTAAGITNYTPLDATHSLILGLRPPKSSGGDNGNLVAGSWCQGDFRTHGAHAKSGPTRCRMSRL